MPSRPRSPTPAEIEAVLHENNIEFSDFLDYHFSTHEDDIGGEDNIGPEGEDTGVIAGNGGNELNVGGESDESLLYSVHRDAIYMYFHHDVQTWLPYPPVGVPQAEELRSLVADEQGNAGSSRDFIDRLVDLGIRRLLGVKKRRREAREEGTKRVANKLKKKRPETSSEVKEKKVRNKLQKR